VTGRDGAQPGRPRWDALDQALAELRACRSVRELADRACPLAVVGCGADAVALGRVAGGVWAPWLRAGQTWLLEPCGTIPSVPVTVDDAPAVERQMIRTARPPAYGPAPGGRSVLVAAVTSPDSPHRVLGLLHVVTATGTAPEAREIPDAPGIPEIPGIPEVIEVIETYAGALGAMFMLLGLRQRAREQKYVLSRLLDGLADCAEPPIELADAPPGIRSGPAADSDRSEPAPPDAPGLRGRLTGRQREVLDLILAGLSNAEIAERLVLSVPTVKSHVRAVLRVGGAVNRSDAVARFSRDTR
jgi:DNA-binding CsgD family transcriptional regulator